MRTDRLVLLGGLCAVAFGGLGLAVRRNLPAVDSWALDNLSLDPDSSTGRVAQAMSGLAVLCCLVVLAVVAVRALWRRPGWGVGAAWSVALLVACVALVPLQAVFDRPGPPGQAGVVTFPSGHATVAGALAVTSIAITAVYLPERLTRVVTVQSAALLVTMASRVAAQEHYVTDVVGAALGVTALALTALAVAPRPQPSLANPTT